MARPRVKAPTLREYVEIVRMLRQRAERDPRIDYVLPLFIAVTGCRVSECLQVSTMDIDFEKSEVAIPTLKSGRGRKRIVPLPRWMLPILQRYIVWNGIGDRLFPVSRKVAWQLTKRSTGWNPHALRHAYGMFMLHEKWDPETVRRLLGHSSWDMVKYYVESVGVSFEARTNPLDLI